jgi:hypothetical protein
VEVRRTKLSDASYPLLEAVEPVSFGFLRLVFDDGYESVIDLRPLMDKPLWRDVRTREDLFALELEESGDYVFWPKSEYLQLPADGLRWDCERQQQAIAALDQKSAKSQV